MSEFEVLKVYKKIITYDLISITFNCCHNTFYSIKIKTFFTHNKNVTIHKLKNRHY